MSLKYRTSAGTSASNFSDLVVKVGDTLPIGSEIDYDGQTAPAGWQEVDDPNVYSTTETRIGTWIDGKPLYRITYSTTSPSTTNDTDLINVSSLSIDFVTRLDAYVKGSETINANYYYASDNFGCIYYQPSGTKIRTVQKKYNSKPMVVTIEYTKTTD